MTFALALKRFLIFAIIAMAIIFLIVVAFCFSVMRGVLNAR